MIYVRVGLDAAGGLAFCKAQGHAKHAACGHDIVCAAVTVLLRTTVLALDVPPAAVKSTHRGMLHFRVENCGCIAAERLQYAADFLWLGLASLQAEYPAIIQCEKQIG